MDLVYDLLVVLHLLGMAAVVGGWIAVRSGRTVTAPIVWGARAQLVTGLALAAVALVGVPAEDLSAPSTVAVTDAP